MKLQILKPNKTKIFTEILPEYKLRYDIIQDKIFFQSVVFLQPSLTDNYYRWNSSSQFSPKVGKHVAILFSFENSYENFNVIGIQKSQTNTTFGLVYSGSNQSLFFNKYLHQISLNETLWNLTELLILDQILAVSYKV